MLHTVRELIGPDTVDVMSRSSQRLRAEQISTSGARVCSWKSVRQNENAQSYFIPISWARRSHALKFVERSRIAALK